MHKMILSATVITALGFLISCNRTSVMRDANHDLSIDMGKVLSDLESLIINDVKNLNGPKPMLVDRGVKTNGFKSEFIFVFSISVSQKKYFPLFFEELQKKTGSLLDDRIMPYKYLFNLRYEFQNSQNKEFVKLFGVIEVEEKGLE